MFENLLLLCNLLLQQFITETKLIEEHFFVGLKYRLLHQYLCYRKGVEVMWIRNYLIDSSNKFLKQSYLELLLKRRNHFFAANLFLDKAFSFIFRYIVLVCLPIGLLALFSCSILSWFWVWLIF